MAELPPLVETRMGPEAGRRRAAGRALETSDVTRFRGLAWGAAVAAALVLVWVVARFGFAGLRSPGPQARPHARAGLGCDKCHARDVPAREACKTCHGGLPSERAGHQALRKKGELGCITCHAIHRADEGVAFTPDGEVIRYGTGYETRLSGVQTSYRPAKTVSVPLVPARVCARCHDLTSPEDPIRDCLIEGQTGLDRASVCFDEHRAVTGRAGSGAKVAPGATTERDAAWEAARSVAALSLRRPLGAALPESGWVALSLALGLAIWGGRRGLVARRARAEEHARRAAVVVAPPTVRRLPRVDASTCLGCYACVDACPYDVLEIRRFVAVVARPEDCCGLTLCEQRCPNGSLVVDAARAVDDRPEVHPTLESVDVPGLFLAGDLTGLPLIKNAINQGSHAVREIAERGKRQKGVRDLVIVGAGPAGISAALEAKQQKLDAVVLEQSSVASSIKSFPRGKLVFDPPLGMPLTGELWLEESTKEELLSKWLRIVRRAELDIHEGRRVTAISKEGEGFAVSAVDEQGDVERHRARHVLLCSGRRGTPRKLAVPIHADAEARVHYALVDARALAGKRVVIAGLGDTAMETAIALAHQPECRVTIVHRGSDFRRGKLRNIEEVKRLVAEGRIDLRFETEVTGVDASEVELARAGARQRHEFDALFVLIGSIVPWDFLTSVGVVRKQAPAAEDGDA